MNKEMGLWIDHKEAVIVLQHYAGHAPDRSATQIQHIESNVGSHTRFKGEAAGATEEDIRDRKHENHLNKFYDEVVAVIRDVKAVYIFGPGEAKRELEKRLAHHKLGERVVGVDTTDKLTEAQIVAHVDKFFRKEILK